jgi:hypothetical protein
MNLDDIVNEDLIAAGIWGGLGLFSGFKVVMLAATETPSAALIGPIIGTICGAVIGYRHVQNLAAIARDRVERDKRRDEMEHEREMAKLGHPIAAESASKFALDPRCAKPSDDTVDVP